MTSRKSRKSLNDALATEFVYGLSSKSSLPITDLSVLEELTPPLDPEPLSGTEPKVPSVLEAQKISRPSAQTTFMTELIQPVLQKEPTVRLTVDLTKTQHQKLSLLCARTGRKKAEIVRMLLNEALNTVEE